MSLAVGFKCFVTRVKRAWKPGITDVSSTSNHGIEAIFNGKTEEFSNIFKFTPGINHLIVGARFNKELKDMFRLSEQCRESDIAQKCAILNSIPKRLRPVFEDIVYTNRNYFVNANIIQQLAKTASKIRHGYDMFIDKPIARIRSKIYFGIEKLKDCLFNKTPENQDLDMDFLKRVFPHRNIVIPENMSKEEMKQYLIEHLNGSHTEKEIQDILNRKSPTFYRFVDETELRAIKNGEKITSNADYNLDYNRTDITSNSEYNFNKYRITFKRNPEWNPFNESISRVEIHDSSSKKWWLYGGYSKDDILCTERVK